MRHCAVLALLVLSPIGAELLAAYNDTRPAVALLGNLVFFGRCTVFRRC